MAITEKIEEGLPSPNKQKKAKKRKSGSEEHKSVKPSPKGSPKKMKQKSTVVSQSVSPSGKAGKAKKKKVKGGQSVQQDTAKFEKKTNPEEFYATPKLKKAKAKGQAKKSKEADGLSTVKKKAVKRKNESEEVGESSPKKKKDSSKKGKSDKPKLVEMTKKDRRKQRKMSKDKNHYAKIQRLKSLWEEARRHDLTKEKKKVVIDKLFGLCKDHLKEYSFAHDTSRVIQCLMKFGTPEQRTAIFEEMKGSMVEMCKSKYAKFLIIRMLKNGSKTQRDLIMKGFFGSVRKLVRHQEASEVVETAYNDYANATQRAAFIQEFYGPSFALYKSPEAKTLEQVLQTNPDKKDSILTSMKDALVSLTDKSVLRHSITHRVLLEFFTHGTDKLKSEVLESMREKLVEMVHTREGTKVAMHCVWHGTSKDRKVIIKSMKTYVAKICKEEHGHLLLMALFDSVDDTKIVQKIIMDEMMKSVVELCTDKHGMKVLLYLLCPRDPRHFHADFVKLLEPGDSNPNSKKDAAVRRKELLQAACGPLINCAADHMGELATNNATLLFVLELLKHSTADPTPAFKALAKLASEPYQQGEDDKLHIIEHPAGHMVLKKLVQNDKERMAQGQTVLFSQLLLSILPSGSLGTWVTCNRGCFLITIMLELEHPDITVDIKEELKNIKKTLSKLTFKGAQILQNKLQSS